jgi:hypothetical protein
MVRQCAWCLRLINSQGEPISAFPLPKLYEATHGMCQSCGLLWMEAVEKQDARNERQEGQTMEPLSAGPAGQTEQVISHSEGTDNKIPLSLFGGRC